MRAAIPYILFYLFLILLFIAALCCGCAGSGLDKKTTLVPDSVTLSLMQEKFKHDTSAWRGASVSATWEFK